MRAVTGPLQTGTYIGQVVDFPGEFATVNGDASKLALTGNPQSPSVKWNIERIGDDLFQIRHTHSKAAPHIVPGQEVGMALEGTSKIIIKETNVRGEYYAAPAQNPSMFLSAAKVQGELQVNVSASSMTRVRIFYAEN